MTEKALLPKKSKLEDVGKRVKSLKKVNSLISGPKEENEK